MEELDLRSWRRMEETKWVLKELAEHFQVNKAQTWRITESWDRVCRLKGQSEVMEYLEGLLNDS